MKKKMIALLSAVPAVAAVGTGIASTYLYRYAFKRLDKAPKGSASNPDPDSKFYPSFQWLQNQPKEDWWLNETDVNNRVHAYFVPNPKNKTKVALIAHGYKGDATSMAASAKLFFDDGYTVLMPDDRSHGLSSGKYINFGWLDRLDYLQWLQKILERMGPDIQIVLYGISMGGATVMMMSGDDLPHQVKAIIEDCGYASVEEELTYQLKHFFNLPKYPLMPVVSSINKIVLGFTLEHGSAVAQLHKNKTPIFFIHGEKDNYVPTSMCFENFQATSAPKDMWIVPNATHAKSYWTAPKEYTQRIKRFLCQYVPAETPAQPD
ncbi:hypothetical protein JCM14202_1032 [Agrilactobacillus composti DSM 18527 = JCM 14202]|nr:alpha/beta hydrolase [Agrilactobacillus composti]GAF39187.1 hypothetical protein JCM14202_1032 [Agrilactobacillus composti DSM 18527 = JCM 14202]